MKTELWARVRALVEAALEHEGSARDAYLKSELARELPEVSAEVLALLAHEESSTALERGFVFGPIEGEPAPGLRLGPWELEEQLGRGGMGEVWAARRADGAFERRVALKFFGGLGAGELLARFERERRVLAALEHRAIARLLDAGGTSRGRPFLVLEYVDGEPIDRYADRLRLDVDRRLALFLEVAAAVEHAHARLVVHRDLKPSNVLVDRGGQVKLLDFGIAKVLAESREEPDWTRTTSRPMTPRYASPEQLRLAPITTAVDVWGLGVLLYELLVGLAPHVPRGPSAADLERAICEDPAPRASAAARQRGEGGATDAKERAARRGTGPEGLARRLSGDLDTLLGTALQKDPDRRYPGVAALSEDVRRHLAGEPLVARPEGALARLGRVLRRHPAAASVLALVVFAALGASFLYRGLAAEARLEGERARALFDLALERSLDATFRLAPRLLDLPGGAALASAQLERAVEDLEVLLERSRGDDGVALRLGEALVRAGDARGGPVSVGIGDRAGAREAYERAAGVAAEVLAADPRDPDARRLSALIQRRIGLLDELAGERETAEAGLEAALATMLAVVDERGSFEDRRALAAARDDLSGFHGRGGRDFERSRELALAAAEGYRALAAEAQGRSARLELASLAVRSRLQVAAVEFRAGEDEAAAARYRASAAELAELRAIEPDSLGLADDLGWALTFEGASLLRLGRNGEAEQVLGRAAGIYAELREAAPDAPRYAARLGNASDQWGVALLRLSEAAGEGDEARKLVSRAAEAFRAGEEAFGSIARPGSQEEGLARTLAGKAAAAEARAARSPAD